MINLIILTILILLSGCLEGQSPNTKPIDFESNDEGGIKIISEREKEGSGYIPINNNTNIDIDWGNFNKEQKEKDVINYTFSDKDPIIITFFNVGFGEKQGRLILIRRGTADVYIWSVPNETYAKAYSYIKSNSDDIEYVIIPSARELNLETFDRLLKDFDIGYTVAPINIKDYYKDKNFDIYLKEKDQLEIAGYKLEVLQAGKDYLSANPGDMGLVLRLRKDDNCMLFLLDIEGGGFQRFVIDNIYTFECDYFSWNSYGVYFNPDTYVKFMDYIKPKVMIADGSSFERYDRGTRLGIIQRVTVHGAKVIKVWQNESTTIIFQ